jgi:hypothetical protein
MSVRIPLRMALVVAGVALGCAGHGWEQVRAQDTAAAYRRFLRESPRSPHAGEAQERLDYLLVKRDPTPEAMERFRSAHPGSALQDGLDQLVESADFETARVQGTPTAYEGFLARHPDGSLVPRAQGNLEYLRNSGFAGRREELDAFARRHPESDYAAEAQRTVGLVDGRSQRSLRRIAIQIEIEPALPDSGRLHAAFLERVRETYAPAGVSLVDGPSASADATLTIRHSERQVGTRVHAGTVEGPGILAETQVNLQQGQEGEPVWSERFSIRVPQLEHGSPGSALFSARGRAYWSRFFVPMATWATQSARRALLPVRGVAAVDAGLGRAIALHADGGFHELDLADPAEPRVVGEYRRPGDPARFSGVRLSSDHVVTFGEDGLEVVQRSQAGLRRARALGRAEVGQVVAVEEAEGVLWVAGSKGLLRTPLAGGAVEPLLPGPLRGLAIDGSLVYVLDDEGVSVAPLADARRERFARVLALGRGLEPITLRVVDGLAVVLGRHSIVCAVTAGLAAARPTSRLQTSEIGEVDDVAIAGSRLFVLGARGLQIVDPAGGHVLDSVDVDERRALDASGRHVVVAGADGLQVVDASPWLAAVAPAALDR